MAHPLTTVPGAHDGAIWSAAWVQGRVITGSVDASVRVWEHVPPEAGKAESVDALQIQHKIDKYHSLGVVSVAASPDGTSFATSSLDSRIKIFDVATGNLQRRIDCGPVDCWSVTYHPDGQRVATGSHTGAVNIWNVTTGEREATLESHGKFILSVAFSADGKFLAAGSQDGAVYVFNVQELQSGNGGRLASKLQAHNMPVRSLAFGPDSKRLFCASDDTLVSIYDTTNFNLQATLQGHLSWVNCLAVSPDGDTLITGSSDNKVKVWDLTSQPAPSCLASFESQKDRVFSVCFSPDGTRFLSVAGDRSIQMYAMPRVEA